MQITYYILLVVSVALDADLMYTASNAGRTQITISSSRGEIESVPSMNGLAFSFTFKLLRCGHAKGLGLAARIEVRDIYNS